MENQSSDYADVSGITDNCAKQENRSSESAGASDVISGCGEPRNSDGLTEKEFLEHYKPGNYDRPSVTVDMLIFTIDTVTPSNSKCAADKVLKLLLIQRKNHPYIYQWALPGGFVNIDESLIEAAKRELKEETGIENVYMEQLYTMGGVNRDPRMRVISTAYMALAPKESLNAAAGDDAQDADWFEVSKELLSESSEGRTWCISLINEEKDVHIKYLLKETYRMNGVVKVADTDIELMPDSRGRIAFDHIEIVNIALERMSNKVEYTPIAFNLLPEEFTLSELQKVYETLLGRSLYKANFRKKIKPMVEETDRMYTKGAYRPGKYYRYSGADNKESNTPHQATGHNLACL